MSFRCEFEKYCEQYGRPDHIELMLCDLNGIVRGKWHPTDQIDKLDSIYNNVFGVIKSVISRK